MRTYGLGAWLVAVAACSTTTPNEAVAPINPTPGTASIATSVSPASASEVAPGFSPQHVAAILIPAVGTVIVNVRDGTAEGSGFVIAHEKALSYMVTNNHVVQGAIKIQVLMPDGKHFGATLQGTDASSDIAILRIEDANLPMATFADSTRLQLGQPVVAIGSPLHVQGSVTSGIISALHRNVQAGTSGQASESLPDVIQTDAPINPGNSGGPLADAEGHVVGVSTAADTRANSIGFAIPSAIARRIAEALIAGRKPGHPHLGISFTDAVDALARGDSFAGYGVLVGGVCSGQPADKAGIKHGDMIEKVDGVELNNGQTLGGVLQLHEPGDKIKITLLRGGGTVEVQATLTERPISSSC